jgi:hypothetical protein
LETIQQLVDNYSHRLSHAEAEVAEPKSAVIEATTPLQNDEMDFTIAINENPLVVSELSIKPRSQADKVEVSVDKGLNGRPATLPHGKFVEALNNRRMDINHLTDEIRFLIGNHPPHKMEASQTFGRHITFDVDKSVSAMSLLPHFLV